MLLPAANEKRKKLMTQAEIWRKKFEELQTCVIIPTYNNAKTLAGVLEDVARFTDNIIVVNDGSTDETQTILAGFPELNSISYTKNRGKGWALRQGLGRAATLGYEYAITLDSDGQHFGEDLPAFIDQMVSTPGSIIIGSRNMDQDTVPGKSSFGRKFSNFWFRLETGISCPDTQSGFRLYPLVKIKDMHFFTRKYEFEIEILVRSAWKGIPIESVPVKVFYAPGKERISHFRPFRDFTRISILNSILVIFSLIYIKPRDFILSLFKKNSWKSLIKNQLFNPQQSDWLKSVSVAFGIFMGIVPVWGFQLALAIVLAILFKLNKALVILAANISIPPMIPLIIYLSYRAGAFWMHGHAVRLRLSDRITYHTAFYHLEQYIYGSITLAIVSGILVGLLTFGLLTFSKKKNNPLN
jgi:glycosyltransferase involved in cell wall biosynthesis